jgi:hypothetical protein
LGLRCGTEPEELDGLTAWRRSSGPPPSLKERSQVPSLVGIDLMECVEELRCCSTEARYGSGPRADTDVLCRWKPLRENLE